jgi:hypothetical protein
LAFGGLGWDLAAELDLDAGVAPPTVLRQV